MHGRTREEDVKKMSIKAEDTAIHTIAHKKKSLKKEYSVFSFFLFDQWNSMFLHPYDVTNESGRRIMLK